MCRGLKKRGGFSLLEMVVTVAIMGIVASIAVPLYQDYVDTTRITNVQNNLRAVYMQQQHFFTDNNAYHATGAVCGDFSADINTNLFDGTNVLSTADNFNYCISQTDTDNFTARAEEVGGAARVFTIDQDGNTAGF